MPHSRVIKYLGLAALMLSFVLVPRHAKAQDLTPEWNECITTGNDSTGLFMAHNSCNQRLSVQFVSRDGNITGTVDVSPGRSSWIPYSSGERSRAGGFDYYVCPSGYIPVDGDGQPIRRGGEDFRCHRN